MNNVAQYMYREDKASFERVLKEIQTKLSGILLIEPKYMENGQMVLHENVPRQQVFIEEPENGLYHQYLMELACEMRKNVGKSFTKQLLVTTHSPFFVNALNPDDVWVLQKGNDGFSTIKRASDYEYVNEMANENVMLGDLWYSKYFG